MFQIRLKVQTVCFMFIAAVCFVICIPAVQATRVLTAQINDCLINEAGYNCEQKTCISTDVSYGVQTQLDVVQVSGTYEETVEIDIEKSIPTLYYPLRFLHTVAYFPYEEVIRTAHPVSGCDCEVADPSSSFWSIKNSFELEYGDIYFAGWRGEELIGQPAATAVPYATAHCVHMGELYFHGYEICEPTEYYEVTSILKKGEAQLEFIMSPADPFYSIDQPAGGFKLKAELLGSLGKYKGVPDLSNYILYIPAFPDTHPYVQDYAHNMLLLPREELSKDGSELDKVGISYYAFRKLGANASVSEAGDGLHNQLFQKHSTDLQKLIMDQDAETEYLVHGKRKFNTSMDFTVGMEKMLLYKVPEINYSQVALTMDADRVNVINTESLGIIVNAQVKPFTSMSDEGNLIVKIQNWGDLETTYVVTVIDMNSNILKAVPAQATVLGTFEQAELTFDIHTAFNMDTSNQVHVQLTSPTGRLYDEVDVYFDTSKHNAKYSGDLRLENNGTTLTEPNNLTPPVITLNGPDLILLECNVDTYVEQGAQAMDDMDGPVNVIIGGDTVDTTVCGIYTIRYFARDSQCNYSEKERTIKVVCPGVGIEGDINHDNKVNMEDLGRLAGNWLVGT